MATYDVTCPNKECENFESLTEIRKGMNEDFPPCPVCNTPVQNVITKSANFSLKGKGWCGQKRR